jgi:hypothetical protein
MPITPDEFAKAVKDLAEEHEMGLETLEFQTFSHAAVGTHTYRLNCVGSLERPWKMAFVGGS